MKALNPNHPVVREMQDQWYKLCAILLFKSGSTEVQITSADIERFTNSGVANIAVHPKGDVITLSLVSDAEAGAPSSEGRGIAGMSDKVEGFLEVGLNDQGEIVVNIPPLKKKREQHKVNCAYRANTEELCNCGIEYEHVVFSPNQARNLANLLIKHSAQSDANARQRRGRRTTKAAEAIPVDRSARVLTNGLPESEMPEYRETDSTGMQKAYVVLSPEERAKGLVRPVRRSYRHKSCSAVTTMGLALAETYARDPSFYGGTFCATCRNHFPLDQFVWEGTEEQVGS